MLWFPEVLHRIEPAGDPRGAGRRPLGGGTFILHETARRHFWRGAGPLSIKCFFGGRALYEVGAGRHAVDDRSYLVLNHGQEYAVTIDSPEPLESFCLFFEDGFAERVRLSLTSPAEALLDDPGRRGAPLRFFEKTYRHDDVVSPLLLRLRGALASRRNEPGWLGERLHAVVERLLAVDERTRRAADDLPSLRPSTREELARRLHRARDFMDASFDEPLSLDDVAGAACLSPNHLLRTFRALFGMSPHAYLTGRRVERARALLAAEEPSVTEVALAVGFESPSAFSRLFRKRTGLSPAAYRAAKR